MEQRFIVFLRGGAQEIISAETYARDGDDWVLYRDYHASREPVGRYPAADVNAIALHD